MCLATNATRVPAAAAVSKRAREMDAIVEWIMGAVQEQEPEKDVSVYDAAAIPGVPLGTYIARWKKELKGTNIVPIACVYLMRWTEAGHQLTQYNVHRVILSALLVAAKWQVDYSISMTSYSYIAGVCKAELQRLEIQFLIDIEWQCHVDAL
ncbi:hypothetical protein DIPPA_21488 [Diplonema papillatum]|nr:hypothetical protein DIPPA_21488 [Diplonema papillatum]